MTNPGGIRYTLGGHSVRYCGKNFKFQFIVLFGLKFVAPMGRQHPADAGGRIATVAELPRNDSVFMTACVYLDAKPYRYVIARERSDRGNPFPLILHFAFCILHFVRQHDKFQFMFSKFCFFISSA